MNHDNILSIKEIIEQKNPNFFCIVDQINTVKKRNKTVKVIVRVKNMEPLKVYIDKIHIDKISSDNVLLVSCANIDNNIFITEFYILTDKTLHHSRKEIIDLLSESIETPSTEILKE